MSAPLFEIELEAVRLQDRAVLHAQRLSLPEGGWTAVVGPNGAGKSTLLRALAGLLPVDGRLALRDRPLPAWPARERARALSWLGQNEPVPEAASAQDVVMLGRLPHQGWLAPASEDDRRAVERAMRRVHCWDWRARALAELSGGERQRVLLARALATEAPVLLLDEPLAHLDPSHQADWISLVRELAREGRSVLAVLHELNVALQADRLLVMHAGRARHLGGAAEPATLAALQAAFDHRLHLACLQGRWISLPFALGTAPTPVLAPSTGHPALVK